MISVEEQTRSMSLHHKIIIILRGFPCASVYSFPAYLHSPHETRLVIEWGQHCERLIISYD